MTPTPMPKPAASGPVKISAAKAMLVPSPSMPANQGKKRRRDQRGKTARKPRAPLAAYWHGAGHARAVRNGRGIVDVHAGFLLIEWDLGPEFGGSGRRLVDPPRSLATRWPGWAQTWPDPAAGNAAGAGKPIQSRVQGAGVSRRPICGAPAERPCRDVRPRDGGSRFRCRPSSPPVAAPFRPSSLRMRGLVLVTETGF